MTWLPRTAPFAEQRQGRDLHAQAAPDAGCPRGHRAGAGRKRGRSRCLKAAAAVGPRRLCSEPFPLFVEAEVGCRHQLPAPSPLSCSTCVVPQHGRAVGNAHQRHARGPQAFIQRCLVGAVQRLVASSRMTMRGVRAKTRANARALLLAGGQQFSQSCDALSPPTRSPASPAAPHPAVPATGRQSALWFGWDR